jgi:hypothetical protein
VTGQQIGPDEWATAPFDENEFQAADGERHTVPEAGWYDVGSLGAPRRVDAQQSVLLPLAEGLARVTGPLIETLQAELPGALDRAVTQVRHDLLLMAAGRYTGRHRP